MPIRPENKARYPAEWPQISREVREAAGQKCEWCRAPNGALIYRWPGAYMLENGDTFDDRTGDSIGSMRASDIPEGRFAKVVLTVAHLDHQPENCDRENLKALCQKCHNTYDAPMRRKGIIERKSLPLFDMVKP